MPRIADDMLLVLTMLPTLEFSIGSQRPFTLPLCHASRSAVGAFLEPGHTDRELVPRARGSAPMTPLGSVPMGLHRRGRRGVETPRCHLARQGSARADDLQGCGDGVSCT